MTEIFIIPDFIKEYITKCTQESDGRLNGKRLALYITPEIQEWQNNNENIPFKVVKQMLISGNYKHPKCETCGKIFPIDKYGKRFCNASCEMKCKEINEYVNKCSQSEKAKEKRKQTNLGKYGVENVFALKENREGAMMKKYGVTHALKMESSKNKAKKTNLERYGCENPHQNKDIIEKAEQTNIEKYGCKNVFQNEEIKQKIKNQNKEKYGVEYYQQTDEYKEKFKETCLEKYEVDNPNKVKEIKEKRTKTFIEKYGKENSENNSHDKFIQKRNDTMIERYGTNNIISIMKKNNMFESYCDKRNKTFRKNHYESIKKILFNRNIEINETLEEFIENNTHSYKCIRCNEIFNLDTVNIEHIFCQNCTNKPFSDKEKELLCWIKSIYSGVIIENDRTVISPKELDIYIPDKHLAIEFNGDYWHREEKIGKYYHREKSLACRDKGIRLIHIFEYEWHNKQEICKSIIKSALGIYDTVIYARKCVIKELNSSDYRDFLDINHLHGAINSSTRYGLYYNDELVSVIGFGKSRFKKDEIELHRFCSKLNYKIIGGLSKLIKYNSIINKFISYVDIAHFNGYGYLNNGFKLIEITSPNYVYMKSGIIISRIQAQKHKLPKLLGENYDKKLSEVENMFNNGYIRIFDSGNMKVGYGM